MDPHTALCLWCSMDPLFEVYANRAANSSSQELLASYLKNQIQLDETGECNEIRDLLTRIVEKNGAKVVLELSSRSGVTSIFMNRLRFEIFVAGMAYSLKASTDSFPAIIEVNVVREPSRGTVIQLVLKEDLINREAPQLCEYLAPLKILSEFYQAELNEIWQGNMLGVELVLPNEI